jgi:CheY-like chemotaxis protein
MRTILLIDDDPAFLLEIDRMLQGAGYVVLKAPDGERAVRLIEDRHEQIDLAIVDLALPGINGFELIGALTRRPNSLKIIATSGVFDTSQLETATAVGAHSTIPKPRANRALPRAQWLKAVEQLIGRA